MRGSGPDCCFSFGGMFEGQRRRKNRLRLEGYDYSDAGAYFVTVVTQGRVCLFGDVVDGEMRLNEAGEVVRQGWQSLAGRYGHVGLDAYVVMPNHLHGVVVLDDGGSESLELRKPLGRLIGSFKTITTQRVNDILGTRDRRLWQRNFYEHVVRDEEDLDRIRDYIAGNPAGWDKDEENPDVAAFRWGRA